MALVLAGYFSAKLCAVFKLPYDSTPHNDPYDYFSDISNMLQFGFIMAWFVRGLEYERFKWLFNRQACMCKQLGKLGNKSCLDGLCD